MNFDEKRQFVQQERHRARKAGCTSCKKQTPWLILEGSPSLFDMLRSNASTADLNAAMRERGWYCRACIAKRAKKAQFEEVLQVALITGEASRRQECEEFLGGPAQTEEYQDHWVELNLSQYVDRMMDLLSDGGAGDVEEAFLMVGAMEMKGG